MKACSVVYIQIVETGILGFAIQETAQGIRNPTKDWNPGTLDERRSHPESKAVLYFLTR